MAVREVSLVPGHGFWSASERVRRWPPHQAACSSTCSTTLRPLGLSPAGVTVPDSRQGKALAPGLGTLSTPPLPGVCSGLWWAVPRPSSQLCHLTLPSQAGLLGARRETSSPPGSPLTCCPPSSAESHSVGCHGVTGPFSTGRPRVSQVP